MAARGKRVAQPVEHRPQAGTQTSVIENGGIVMDHQGAESRHRLDNAFDVGRRESAGEIEYMRAEAAVDRLTEFDDQGGVTAWQEAGARIVQGNGRQARCPKFDLS